MPTTPTARERYNDLKTELLQQEEETLIEAETFFNEQALIDMQTHVSDMVSRTIPDEQVEKQLIVFNQVVDNLRNYFGQMAKHLRDNRKAAADAAAAENAQAS